MEVAERILFLDTETTGLDPRAGHRLIEIAAVESVNRKLTGRVFHHLVNPGRDIDPGATAVHGLTAEDLVDKPKFADIVDEFIEFVKGATVVIHNAAFDLGFLNAELTRARGITSQALQLTVIDSLLMAREQFPGKRNSLDALCDRLGVDNTARNVHGAVLDSRLLAEVYFGLTRGQAVLGMEDVAVEKSEAAHVHMPQPVTGTLAILEVPDSAREAHMAWLASVGASANLWEAAAQSDNK
jgi:DNA polymerase III subunit epsilon